MVEPATSTITGIPIPSTFNGTHNCHNFKAWTTTGKPRKDTLEMSTVGASIPSVWTTTGNPPCVRLTSIEKEGILRQLSFFGRVVCGRLHNHCIILCENSLQDQDDCGYSNMKHALAATIKAAHDLTKKEENELVVIPSLLGARGQLTGTRSGTAAASEVRRGGAGAPYGSHSGALRILTPTWHP